MLESSDVVAFAAAADLTRARGFYEDKLGLHVVEQNDFACVFNANGTMLRVTDIEATVQGLIARGVMFKHYDGMDQDEHGIWATPSGEKVAWFADPDGN